MFPLELSRALAAESATSLTGAKLPFAVKIGVFPSQFANSGELKFSAKTKSPGSRRVRTAPANPELITNSELQLSHGTFESVLLLSA